MALKEGVRVEANGVAVDKSGDRAAFAGPDGRTKIANAGFPNVFQLGEGSNRRVQNLERRNLLSAGVNQHGHSSTKRHVGEAGRWLLEETTAGERQRPHLRIAERVVEHGRASARRMIADRFLGLEDGHFRMAREQRRRGQTRDPAANDQDVAGAQAPEPASLSLTILPP